MGIANISFRDEFVALFRYRLFSYYKLYTRYTPNPSRVSREGFDSLEQLREKIKGYIKYHNPATVPESEFVINYTPPVKQLHTVKELKDYIAALSRTLQGFDMRRIAEGDTLPASISKFQMSIVEELATYNLTAFIDNVLDVIAEIPILLELSDKETQAFYRDLVNNSAAKVGVLTIVNQVIREFLEHKSPEAERKAIQEAPHCGCTGRDGKPKAMYPRLSFALVVAENDMNENRIDTLKVYLCNSKTNVASRVNTTNGANAANVSARSESPALKLEIHHLTKQSH